MEAIARIASRWRQWGALRLICAAVLCIAASGVALEWGQRQQVGGDCHVFWQAGRNFATGAPLYHAVLPGARPFIYPPFAAMLFQALAIFPLPIAAALLSFVNIVLLPVSIWLSSRVIGRMCPDRAPRALLLALATALSLQFFLDNFHHVQVNEIVFVLILLGIDAHLRAHDVRAAAYFVVATALKLAPVFFVLWLIVRGRRRAAWAVPTLAIACVGAPLVWRGPATGAAELAEYYHSFLERHQHGDVWMNVRNQSLGAMIYRMTRPMGDAEQTSYAYLPASERAAALAYEASAALVLLVFLVQLGLLRARQAPASPYEFSTVFLVSHLLSPMTERAHLVTFLFIGSSVLLPRWSELSLPSRLGVGVLWAALALGGLSGRDVVGPAAYDSLAGYSVLVWAMLLLYFGSLALTPRAATLPLPRPQVA